MSARKAASGDGPYPLPEGWKWVKLGEVADIIRKSLKPENMNGEEPYLGLDCIAPGGRIIRWTTTSVEEVISNKFTFTSNHVLMGKLRPYLGKIAAPDRGGVCSTDIIPLLPGAELEKVYLLHWLRTDVMVREANKVASGANLPRISPKAIAALDVPLPPLPEQRRIAEILDGVSTAIEAATLSIDSLADLASREYNIRFGQDPMVSFVEDISEEGKNRIRTGPFGSQLKKEEYSHSGISVLGLDNVVGNEFSWGKRRYIPEEKYESLKRYTVRPGDVLISIMATTGRCVVVPEGIPTSINTKHICAITVDQEKVIPEFLRATFLWNPSARSYLNRQTKGAIMSGLNMSIVKNMPVPVPSIGRQEEFVKFCRRIDIVAGYLKSRSSFLGELLNSLQSRAFRGEL
ncbi:restriction endonuclease subunit S [Corynebacterium variabile]|uniref:restriction endonuclease subunit S n=1 Tax=Corynebacterium variabile TaxID=1727 RepID=UPI003FD1691D